MPLDPRKWWHSTLKLLDTLGQFKTSITTADPSEADSNANPRITARETGCSLTDIPPAAWDATESGGYFIYRPTLDDLGGVEGHNYITPNNVEDVLALENRYIFQYDLLYAYDPDDVDCTTVGPPSVIADTPLDVTQDLEHGTFFLFDPLPYLDKIGCCDIEFGNPGDPLSPGVVNECSRLWSITQNEDGDSHLYFWDFAESPGDELVDRGVIVTAGQGTKVFFDIAWDNENRLWSLESQGIREILPGDEDSEAVAVNYCLLSDNFGGAAIDVMFPVDEDGIGTPGLSFNQNNERLYVSSNGHFFEMERLGGNGWNIISYIDLGEGSDLGDLAFDPFGNCYCIFNNNLCLIDFQESFGAITNVSEDDSFEDIVGLDFILDLDVDGLVVLYAVDTDGQMYEVDTGNGTKSLISGATFGETAIGASSCQAGENTKTQSLPFFPGSSPWIFMLDGSSSMKSNNKWDTVVAGMFAFLENNVVLGDKMTIVVFNEPNNPKVSPTYIFQTEGDITAAEDWLNLQSPSNSSPFCDEGPFSNTFLAQYNGVKNIVVIGDGGFVDCAEGDELEAYFLDVVTTARNTTNPGVIVRAIGIYPDQAGKDVLTILGTVGEGGYTEWTF